MSSLKPGQQSSSVPVPLMGSSLPSIRALRIFECVARYGNFSRAATELNTSQPSVSRNIADLERRLSIKLIDRGRRGARLTEAGEALYPGIASALTAIDSSIAAASGLSGTKRLVIACGLGTSQLFLMPRFEGLREALGGDVCVRILTCDYDTLARLTSSDADIMISYSAHGSAPNDRRVLLRPTMGPVCSPDFAVANRDALRRPVEEWGTMPFLSYARPARGWAIWDDWFDVAGWPNPPPAYVDYHDYTYLMDACMAGRGLALAWGAFVERQIDAGQLVAAAEDFIEFDCTLYAVLTELGRLNPVARQCLECFPDSLKLPIEGP